MNVREALLCATRAFAEASFRTPRADAEVIVSLTMGCSRTQLLARGREPLAAGELDRFEHLLGRRLDHEPLAYLRGHQEFYGRNFTVTPAVLIPRPETELLVDVALQRLRSLPAGAPAVLDVGTGSGCIALTLLAEDPRLKVVASDVSREALEVARENASALGCRDRLTLLCSDLFTSLPAAPFDVIVSNPPYGGWTEKERVDLSVQKWEPPAAVFSGPRGFEIHERFLAQAPPFLKAGGRLVIEIGEGQLAGLQAVAARLDWAVAEIHPDLAGIDRCVVLRPGAGDV